MNRNWLFLIILLFVRGSTYAQSDTMIVDNASVVKRYQISQIDSITFSFSLTGAKDESSLIAGTYGFKISQNYPNPFNPSTKLQFRIPKAGKVGINIFDINGRLIKHVFSGEKDAGEYSFEWNGDHTSGQRVGSGVYFYSVQFNNVILTKKMIFIK